MAEMTAGRVTAIALIAGAISGGATAAIVTLYMREAPIPADIPFAGNESKAEKCCVDTRDRIWKKRQPQGGAAVLQCKPGECPDPDKE